MSLKHTMLNKRRHTKEDLLYNPTCESVEQANWAIVTEGRSEVALGWGWRIPDLTARDKRTSWGDGHILHLDQGNGYMGISTCQNPLDCTLKMGALHWGLCILSCVWLLATPWTVACQGPLSMGFPRQEYCSGFAISFSRGSSWPRDRTCLSFVSCIGRWIYHWATQETHCIEVRVLAAQSCPILCNPRAVPARLLFPWNSPGKNTGVGCHSQPRDRTLVSCTAGRFFIIWAKGT